MEKCDKCGATGAIAYVPKGTPNGPQTETWPVFVCHECGGHGTKLTYDEVCARRNALASIGEETGCPKCIEAMEREHLLIEAVEILSADPALIGEGKRKAACEMAIGLVAKIYNDRPAASVELYRKIASTKYWDLRRTNAPR